MIEKNEVSLRCCTLAGVRGIIKESMLISIAKRKGAQGRRVSKRRGRREKEQKEMEE
jgi:hypothetical protein